MPSYDHTDPDQVLARVLHGLCTRDDAPEPGPDDSGNDEACRLARPHWQRWEEASRATLVSLLGEGLADHIIEEEGPSWLWDVWATVAGEGVGIRDGRWDRHLTEQHGPDAGKVLADALTADLKEAEGACYYTIEDALHGVAMVVWMIRDGDRRMFIEPVDTTFGPTDDAPFDFDIESTILPGEIGEVYIENDSRGNPQYHVSVYRQGSVGTVILDEQEINDCTRPAPEEG